MASKQPVESLFRRALESGFPLVGGHRGNPAEHPENTLLSFRSAVELGVDMIECDVHMSADGELVVIHDHTLERTTNGAGFVGQMAAADLRRLDAGGGQQVPFLQEVLELALAARVGLCIEIKTIPFPYPGLEEKLLELLRSLDMVGKVAVISFQHSAVRTLKEMEPGLAGGILEGARPIDPAGLMKGALAEIYAPHYGAMDPLLVSEVHSAGGVVGTWTVDDQAAVAWCRVCRPDFVFTNRPREVAPALRD